MIVSVSIVTAVGAVLGAAFLVYVIVCGLLCLSEFMEAHVRATKHAITIAIWIVLFLHVLLLLDGFSAPRVLFSAACHVAYAATLRTFPFIALRDPLFASCCLLALANHCSWFTSFTPGQFSMIQLAAFYGVCLWLVPLLLFLSLAVGDHILPSMGSGGSSWFPSYQTMAQPFSHSRSTARVTLAVMPKGKFSALSGSYRSLVGGDGEPVAPITPARMLSSSSLSHAKRSVHED
ncbi:hypothetical protein AMAG_18378 [Allomyces macrogynus ATCC 38327]|uniref:Protein SVP26 n=1 Tax=Allomyces macrogynus (strain ATCC 38327) TaxID=578462 RepID=A0A0L0S6S7_ALLM3|nr:hypothetical protein AMAG_18378 [Allomyces macrogynus ATCC 38327]|eukprot:KNE58130.1 hypothetical protein AMAG_18378 [Allomyces macrogynus ATCC 38327]